MVARQRFQAALRRSDRRDYSRRLRRQHHRLAGEYVRHARGPRRQRRARDVGRARRRDLYGVDGTRTRAASRSTRTARASARSARTRSSRAARSPVTRRRCSSRCSPAKHTAAARWGAQPRDEVSRPCHPGQRGDQPAAHRRRHRPRRPARCSTRATSTAIACAYSPPTACGSGTSAYRRRVRSRWMARATCGSRRRARARSPASARPVRC